MSLTKRESGLRRVYSNYRSRAYKRQLDFSLTTEEFLLLITARCFYCGVGPERVFGEGDDLFICGTIDRIDSALGYFPANSRPACVQCNWAKGRLDEWAFYAWAERLFKNLSERRLIENT